MKIPLTGRHYKPIANVISAIELVNWYAEIPPENSGADVSLIGCPGLSSFCDTGINATIRGMYSYGSYIYAVVSNKFYRINPTTGAKTLRGTLLSSVNPVKMDDNGTQIMLIDENYGYIYDLSTATLTRITDPDFPVPSSLFQLDGYFFITERNSGRFYSSALRDGTSWNALHYNNAEGDSDNLVVGVVVNREAWLLGTRSSEVWYNAGSTSGTPLARRNGVFIHYGCAAKDSAIRVDNSIMWLGTNEHGGYFLLRGSGYQVSRVSDHSFETAIEGMSTVSDAIAYAHVVKGHTFYAISFPTADQTWEYNLSTGLINRRESYNGDAWGRHRACCHTSTNKKHFVGDHSNGKIYEMSPSYYDDDGHNFRSIWSTQTLREDQRNIFFSKFQVLFAPGVGLEDGTDPQAMLQYSDDNGNTWSNELWVSIGKIGEYSNRAIWWGLGSGRNRIFRVVVSDPVKRVLADASVDLEVGIS